MVTHLTITLNTSCKVGQRYQVVLVREVTVA